MLLTDEERLKFMAYLEQNADSARLLLKQMEGKPYAAPLIQSFKQEIAAMLIVAKKLRETESMTIK